MKKKIFLKILLIVSIMQFVIWGLFVFNAEILKNAPVMYTILIVIPIAYFIIENKYIKRLNISRLWFTTISLILWNIINIGIAVLANILVEKGILAHCSGSGWDCFFNGIEYLIFPFLFTIESLVILVLKLIYWIYKECTKNIAKENIKKFVSISIALIVIILILISSIRYIKYREILGYWTLEEKDEKAFTCGNLKFDYFGNYTCGNIENLSCDLWICTGYDSGKYKITKENGKKRIKMSSYYLDLDYEIRKEKNNIYLIIIKETKEAKYKKTINI